MSPLKALSTTQYFGLTKGAPLKPLSRTGLTLKIASRSLFRRKSATVRIVIFISIVFLLLTVSIAGGIIANDTSTSWVKQAVGQNTILIARPTMAEQYTQLLLAFSEGQQATDFNYADPSLAIPDDVIVQLSQLQGVSVVDERLILETTIQEISGYTVDPDTLATIQLGDSRQMNCVVIGVDGAHLASYPYTTGVFLNGSSPFLAVVGDSVAKTIYCPIVVQQGYNKGTVNSDALRQGVNVEDTTLSITGITLEPFNNGNVTYVPLSTLENATGLSPNLILVNISSTSNYQTTLNELTSAVHNLDPQLSVVELNQITSHNVNFLGSLWGVIMFLPAFALASATLCLISFQMLTIEEQRQEFAILRATGAKPATVVGVLAVQRLIVLAASLGVGVSLGTIVCILVLTTHPVVSAFTVVAISTWLLAALAGMFLVSLYPAIRFARKSLLQIMS
jgi:ABC-type antimicrobial peptide transport system permease subunit